MDQSGGAGHGYITASELLICCCLASEQMLKLILFHKNKIFISSVFLVVILYCLIRYLDHVNYESISLASSQFEIINDKSTGTIELIVAKGRWVHRIVPVKFPSDIIGNGFAFLYDKPQAVNFSPRIIPQKTAVILIDNNHVVIDIHIITKNNEKNNIITDKKIVAILQIKNEILIEKKIKKGSKIISGSL